MREDLYRATAPVAPPVAGAPSESAEEGPESPLATFRDQLISFRTMSRPLQVLTVVAVVQLAGIVMLLLLHDVPQPQLATSDQVNGQALAVPLGPLVALVVAGVLGYSYVLAGAMLARWPLRFLVPVLLTAALGFIPAADLFFSGPAGHTGLAATETSARWGQVVVLGVMWVWVLGVSAARGLQRSGAGTSAVETRHGRVVPGLFLALALMLAYYGLELRIWWAFQGTSLAGVATQLVVDNLTLPILATPLVLGLVAYWLSTDMAEWGRTLAGAVTALVGRWPVALFALTGLAALVVAGVVIYSDGAGVISSLVAAAVIGGVLALALRLAPVRRDWPAEVPPLALLLGAVFIFAAFDVATVVGYALPLLGHLPATAQQPIQTMATLVLILASLTAGLFLAARGHQHGWGDLAAVGLFLVAQAVLTGASLIGNIERAVGFGALPQPDHLLGGLELATALATLGGMLWLLAQRRPLVTMATPLATAFILLAALEAIGGLIALSQALSTISVLAVVATGSLFLAAALWAVLTSGDITNGDTPAYPRAARVLLYLGYILVISAAFLLTSSLRVQATGDPAPSYLTDNASALLGLALLAPPLVVVGALLRLGRWRAIHVGAVEVAPALAGRARPVQIAILGAGVLAVALVVGITLLDIVPRANASGGPRGTHGPTTYSAAAPGPDCDHGGAKWTYLPANTTITCTANGLQVTAPPSGIALVGFIPPPAMAMKGNYRVAVRISFGPTGGCAGIVVRASDQGYYQFAVCSDGGVLILRGGDPSSVLARANVAPDGPYRMDATARGATLQLAINGSVVATATDTSYPSGDIELTFANVGTIAESAIFSDFVYTPLS